MVMRLSKLANTAYFPSLKSNLQIFLSFNCFQNCKKIYSLTEYVRYCSQ